MSDSLRSEIITDVICAGAECGLTVDTDDGDLCVTCRSRYTALGRRDWPTVSAMDLHWYDETAASMRGEL